MSIVVVTTFSLAREPVFGTPPLPRYGYATALRGDRLLVFGGATGETTAFSRNDLFEFSLGAFGAAVLFCQISSCCRAATMTWRELVSVGTRPQARNYLAGVVAAQRF